MKTKLFKGFDKVYKVSFDGSSWYRADMTLGMFDSLNIPCVRDCL